VSEYMPGMNARQFAAERQITAVDLRAVAVQLMQALLVGEHLRLPHGDPKPSNLLLADHPSGGVFLQIQDWGLSQAREAQPHETMWFMAPERHAGAPATSQSDLFTAAASLFVLATNTAPAQGDTPEQILAEWQTFNVVVLHQMRPDIDPAFIEWLGWLMKLDPAQRPQSVAQALDSLMLSMHTGMIQMPPRQAPVMAAGYQTGPLVQSGTSPMHPSAPRPKPVGPKTTATASAGPATAKDKPVSTCSSGAQAQQRPPRCHHRAQFHGADHSRSRHHRPHRQWRRRLEEDGGCGLRKAGLWLTHSCGDGGPRFNQSRSLPTAPQPAPAIKGIMARYVRIEAATGMVINLAEVEVISDGQNIASEGKGHAKRRRIRRQARARHRRQQGRR
jgi:serine/threonine protein kinase